MDMKTIMKWLYIAGVVVAALTGALAYSAEWLSWVLLAIGILVGIFASGGDTSGSVIRFLGLAATAGALAGVPAVGGYLTGLFGGLLAFFAPVVLTQLTMWGLHRYFGLSVGGMSGDM
jgi:hypothetical protein